MFGSFVEFGRLTYLTFQPEAARKPVVSTVPGKPQAVLAVPGLFSAASHLSDVREATLRRMPHGSRFDIHEPTTGVNLGLVDFRTLGIPHSVLSDFGDLREREVRTVMNEMDRLADESQEPVTAFGHSLGGLIALEAWTRLRDPNRVTILVTAGSPHKNKLIRFPDRPDTGMFQTYGGEHDIVVSNEYSQHERADSHDPVNTGHFGFLVSAEGTRAVAEAIAYPVYPQTVAA